MKYGLLTLASLCIVFSSVIAQKGVPFYTTISGVTFSQTPYTFTQKVDHFKVNNINTWEQNYVVYSSKFNPLTGVVFISIGGESAMNGISNGRGWLVQLAEQYEALVVSVEHRFYGASQPFGQGNDAYSTSNLKYLTADQALEDLATIVKALKSDPELIKLFGASERNPFITVGGSYPGALSAWFRAKYPHLTAGALASSAVVNTIVDFSEYDFQVFQSSKEVNQDCPVNIMAFNNQVETLTKEQDQTAIKDLKASFSSSSMSNIEFLYYIADMQASLVQYGNSVKLCNIFNTNDYTTSLNNFLAYLKNPDGIIPTPLGYTVTDLLDTKYVRTNNMRQWQYQVCTYYGWLQTVNDVHPMRSSQLTIDYFLNQCIEVFGEGYLPNENITNQYWGGLGIQATNIVFTNGSQDPWKWASLLSSKKNIVSIETVCVGCAHGCELGFSVDGQNQAITETKNQVASLFTKWAAEHLAKYSFTIPTAPTSL